MKGIIEEYGGFIIAFLIGCVLISSLIFFGMESGKLKKSLPDIHSSSAGNNQIYVSRKPLLEVQEHIYFKTLPQGTELTGEMFSSYIQAEDYEGKDIRKDIKILDTDKINPSLEGTHVITFNLTSNGITVSKKAVILFNNNYQST